MERLWTPWRMAYIDKAPRQAVEECFLCQHAAAPPAEDEANLVVFRGERAFVALNLYPYNSGHLMVAPYRHVGDLAALDPTSGQATWELAQQAVAALQQEYQPDGFNLGMNLGRSAGAGLPGHLHMHVVPRWPGDTNFMPVVGETKVLPETLQQTYRRLRPRLQALAASDRTS